MKPPTALGIIRDLVSNSQLLRRITTQMYVCETLTINLGVFSTHNSVLRMYQLFHGAMAYMKPH